MNHLRYPSRQFYRYIMNRVMSKLDENDLTSTATVFSPHPDDETLGCGGTIIKKKRAGAEVKIFFMTDGRKSHSHLVPENELKRIRTNEALAASRILGVEENDVAFLEYKDGELTENQDSAIHKVVEILRLQQPDEIFIPARAQITGYNLNLSSYGLTAFFFVFVSVASKIHEVFTTVSSKYFQRHIKKPGALRIISEVFHSINIGLGLSS